MNQLLKKLFLIVCVVSSSAFGFDNAHFYKAPYFNGARSWNDKNWLSTCVVQYANGSSSTSKNNHGRTTGAFELYGKHNLLYLTKNVPQPDSLSGVLLDYVNALDDQRTNFENNAPADNHTFGLVNFCGKCSVDEFIFNYRQNLAYNFFLEGDIPIRRVATGPLEFVDCSPSSATKNTPYTQTDTAWVNFLGNLDAILQAYDLRGYQCRTKNTNLGDITTVMGWQYSIGKIHSWFEYAKFSLRAGILFPSGLERNFRRPFSLETGYNGHWGLPLRLDLILGLSKDIYFGGYCGLIFFSSKSLNGYPVKTHGDQSGFIKLYRAKVREEKGTMFDIGTHLKLDHFFKGLSVLVGYSYNRQGDKTLSLVNGCEETNNPIINNDCRLKNWYQHVLHIFGEYDFGVHTYFKKRKWKPVARVFYDHPFDGKRVIMNPMLGASISWDFSWI